MNVDDFFAAVEKRQEGASGVALKRPVSLPSMSKWSGLRANCHTRAEADENDRRVAEWYIGFLMEHHYAPTMREVMQHAGLHSSSSAKAMLERMVAKGYIKGYRRKSA